MRVSQVEIEPVLQRAVLAEPLVEARWGHAFEAAEEDAAGVTVTLRRAGDGGVERVRCRYLAGCDGGTSLVRKGLGIALEGQARVMPRFMTHIRSEDPALHRFAQAWHYQSPLGTLIAQDDDAIWTLQSRFPPGVEDPGAVDPRDLLRRFFGRDPAAEILVANPWTPHLLVAESYGTGRVLLAGDAAHQYIPTGGYGMNTGIGDAADLGWKLAALVLGFGGPGLAASYDSERRPVGRRNRDASGRHTGIRIAIGQVYAEFGEALLTDAAAQAAAGARIAALGNAENESWGIEFGYCYQGSTIIAAEPGAAVPDDPLRYEPVTLPGARLPSLFLADGTAVFDRLGPWFSLIATGVAPDAGLVAAAARRGMPLAVLALEDPAALAVYGRGLLLVRPDQHIAWRGTGAPAAPDAVVGRALGF